MVEANDDELIYEITFDLPNDDAPKQPLGDALNDTIIAPTYPEDDHSAEDEEA